MKTRKFLWALLPVAAVLLMTACGGDDTDDVTPTPTPNPVTPGTENVVKSVPYSVTVKTADVTRTSVSDDTTLKFEADDKLYVQNVGGTVYGCLELKSGVGETSATFAGTVNYTGSTPPDTNTELTATLVGEGNLLNMIGTDGKVKDDAYITVPATPCETMSEAVKKYSWIRGTGTYGEADFTLKQRTAFMMFSVTIQDGTVGGVEVPVKITNDSEIYSFNQTTTGSQFDAHISFVLPFEEGKTIDGEASMCVANVGTDDDESIRIGTGTDVTLAGGNVYPVTRTKDFVRLWANGPLWSTRNVGATDVTDAGGYYQWGGKDDVTSTSIDLGWNSTYPHWASGTGTSSDVLKFKKYVLASEPAYWGGEGADPDGKTQLEPVDDVATAKLGSPWHMPTLSEFNELLSNTTNAWTTVNSVNGRTFTGEDSYANKAIFLRATGQRSGTGFDFTDEAFYWSSTLASSMQAQRLHFTSSITETSSHARRYYGRPVRAICTN